MRVARRRAKAAEISIEAVADPDVVVQPHIVAEVEARLHVEITAGGYTGTDPEAGRELVAKVEVSIDRRPVDILYPYRGLNDAIVVGKLIKTRHAVEVSRTLN